MVDWFFDWLLFDFMFDLLVFVFFNLCDDLMFIVFSLIFGVLLIWEWFVDRNIFFLWDVIMRWFRLGLSFFCGGLEEFWSWCYLLILVFGGGNIIVVNYGRKEIEK